VCDDPKGNSSTFVGDDPIVDDDEGAGFFLKALLMYVDSKTSEEDAERRECTDVLSAEMSSKIELLHMDEFGDSNRLQLSLPLIGNLPTRKWSSIPYRGLFGGIACWEWRDPWKTDSTIELLPIDEAEDPYLLQPSFRLLSSVLLSPSSSLSTTSKVFTLAFIAAVPLVGVKQ
jgi:hypothetical protein